MADGGVDIQMGDISTETITTRSEHHMDDMDPLGDLSTYSFDDDGKTATHNTIDTNRLSTDDSFTTPRRSRTSQEPRELFPGKGSSLSGPPLTYIPSPEKCTDVTQEEIKKALEDSRTTWLNTTKGIDNMANNIRKKDGNFYLVLKGADTFMREYQLTYKEQTGTVRFYAYSRLKGDHGKDIADLVQLLFANPDQFNEKLIKMGLEPTEQIRQKDEITRKQKEVWEEWRHRPQNEPGYQDEPGPSRREPQAATTAETSFFEEIMNSPNPIDRLIGATEDELRSMGFTEHDLNDWKALVQSSINLVAERLVTHDLRNKINELEGKLREAQCEDRRIKRNG